MAKKFLTPIDLTGNELRNVLAQNLASAPGSPNKGQFYYDTGANILYWYNGSTWVAAQGGTPSGAASGDLTGTYPGPTLGANVVTGAKVNASSVAQVLLLTGLASGRPAAAAGNTGMFYFASDTNGGTLYQSTGSVWTQVAGGVSQSQAPNGAASGDLTGTYPSPTLGANVVTAAKISATSVGGALLLTGIASGRPTASGANTGLYYFATDTNGGTLYQSTGSAWTQLTRGINEVELLANKNAVNGYAGLNGSTQIALAQIPVASSGTSSSTQVVRADDSRLSDTRTPSASSIVDAMVSASAAITFSKIAAPIAATTWNSQRITNLADPSSAQDAATKNYVDSVASGLDFKASVRVASTGANLTLSGTQTIDGVAVIAGDRVLAKDQSTASANGIYVVAAGAWARSTDLNSTANYTAGSLTYVESGTVNGGTQWIVSTTGAITVGTTSVTWTQFSGASVATAGAGLTATGNVFAVGAGTGITVAADSISIDTTVVVRKYAQAIVGSSTSEVITHGLGTQDVTVSVYNASTPWDEVQCDINHTSTNTITLGFTTAPSAGAYRVVVHG